MKDVNVRRFEMCVRCDGYLTEHPPAFGDGSLGSQLVSRFTAVVDEIHSLNVQEQSASASGATKAKSLARNSLLQTLEKISRCAQGMAITAPQLDKKFQMPRR